MTLDSTLQVGENAQGEGKVSIPNHSCAGGQASPEAALDWLAPVEAPCHLQYQNETFDTNRKSV